MTDTDPFEDPDIIIIDTDLLDLPPPTPTPLLRPRELGPKEGGTNRVSAKEMRKAKIAERKRKRNNRPPRYINSR